jgi:hypothetical protein
MMALNSERMQILEMIESGKISAAEGLQLLQSLGEPDEPTQISYQDRPESEARPPGTSFTRTAIPVEMEKSELERGLEYVTQDPGSVAGEDYSHPLHQNHPEGLPPDAEKWRSWWVIPLWVGVGITIVAGSLMYTALQSSGIGFWFLCASVPFTLGLILLVLAWQSRSARWLHLRIQQRPGQSPGQIALSFPLPIRLTAWFFRTFQKWIPGLKNSSIDEIILALDHAATPENPVFISVNDEKDGENVQIFIG